MKSNVLTSEQALDIDKLKEEAVAAFDNPVLTAGLAGMASSRDGNQKIIEILDKYFGNLEEYARDLPDEFRPDISSEILAGVDTAAIAYLFVDRFRPQFGWTLSAKKRAIRNEFNNEMDRRVMFAACALKMARSFLRK